MMRGPRLTLAVIAAIYTGACSDAPRKGVDWSNFDYRKTEQMAASADNDSAYVTPNLCLELCE